MLVSVAPSSASAVAMSMPATLRDSRLAIYLNMFNFRFHLLNGVSRRFGGVLPAGRGGPAERPVRKLVDRPARVLLEPVIAPALRARVTQARPAARLIRRV